MFESILSDTAGTLSISTSLICMAVSIILGLVIACVHMYTTKYSKNFIVSLAVLPALVQVVIMMVNGNLGTSVAILGVFGLVRFRSIPGTAKEIVSVFFAMAVGLAVGMGHIMFAVYVTLIISLVIFIMSKTKFAESNNIEKKLKIVIPEELDYENEMSDILKEYTTTSSLEKVKTINMGSMYEITYKIVMQKEKSEKELLDKIRTRNGNLTVSLYKEEEGLVEL